MKLIIRKNPKVELSLKKFNERKNKVLIKRKYGGYGDILMQRMLFEDLKSQFPNLKIEYCCPQQFLPFAKNPYINAVSLDSIDSEQYGAIFDISKACGIHEMKYGINNELHRSDIWANSMGIELENHNMHLSVPTIKSDKFKEIIKKHNINNLPLALIAPHSKLTEFGIAKSLPDNLLENLVSILKKKGFFIFSVHHIFYDLLHSLNVLQFTDTSLEEWIYLTNLSNLVVSVDSATFHLAGGLKKPLVGIFAFTNGKVYGKYYDFVLVQKHKDNGDWFCGPCYNYGTCPKSNLPVKPCMSELRAFNFEVAIDKAIKKWNLIS